MPPPPRTTDRPVKELGRPPEQDVVEEEHFRWPARSVGMKMADLWGSLHDEYNTLRIPIQCQGAFHLDVKELATQAADYNEFHRLMAERSDARFREAAQAHRDLAASLVMSGSRFPYDLWNEFVMFTRSKSATDLAIFFAGFQDPEHRRSLIEQDARVAAQEAERAKKANKAASLPPPAPQSPAATPAPADPPSPPEMVSLPEQSPIDMPIQHPEPMPPASPPTSDESPDRPSSLFKPFPSSRPKRQTRPRKQTTGEIVKRNLRPRAAAIPSRKESARSSRRNKAS